MYEFVDDCSHLFYEILNYYVFLADSRRCAMPIQLSLRSLSSISFYGESFLIVYNNNGLHQSNFKNVIRRSDISDFWGSVNFFW